MKTIPAKTIITRVKCGDTWFGCDYNMNIYRGCCHGCIYCDSRSDCYRVENFDRVAAKENALDIIGRELSHKVFHGVVGTGAMSDPYNPFEMRENLTRGALELLDRYGFGVHLITKSDLVTRDIDRLQAVGEHSPVCVCLTVTTFDDALCKKIEPRAPVTSQRLAAIKKLSQSGIFTGITLMPILPYINDTWENISAIVTAAAENGARFIYPFFGVTMRDSQREYLYNRLDENFPGMKEKYKQRFGNYYKCNSPNSSRLYRQFAELCGKYGLLYKMNEIIAAYKQGRTCEQLRLF
jgi:DNA repair photolyase